MVRRYLSSILPIWTVRSLMDFTKTENMNIEKVREYCLTLPYVTEDEFCPEVITFRIEGKWFLMMWLSLIHI